MPNLYLAYTENVGVQLDDLMSFEYNNPVDRSKCLVDSKKLFMNSCLALFICSHIICNTIVSRELLYTCPRLVGIVIYQHKP